MKKLRKHTLGGIAAFLLLCFSAVLFPSDLFHQHRASLSDTTCTSTSGQQCQHKMHLVNKTSFCWLCAIHFDKDFASPEKGGEMAMAPARQLLIAKYTPGVYQPQIFQHNLRGPPVE